MRRGQIVTARCEPGALRDEHSLTPVQRFDSLPFFFYKTLFIWKCMQMAGNGALLESVLVEHGKMLKIMFILQPLSFFAASSV